MAVANTSARTLRAQARLRRPTDREAVWLLVAAGIVLRVARYLVDRPLWLDEAMLSINITDKSFGSLLGTLNFKQGSPPAFLIGEKLAVEALGRSEYALRLLPLLLGIASLVLFQRLALAFLSRRAALLALGLFAVFEPLIYYSAEVKQYGGDVFATLLLLLLGHAVLVERPRPRTYVQLAAAGAAVMWFSHASLLVMAAIGTVLAVSAAQQRQWRGVALLALPGSAWAVSFAVLDHVTLRRQIGGLQRTIVGEHSPYALPFPPTSTADARWFASNVSWIFRGMAGWPTVLAAAAVLLCAVGVWARLRRDPRGSALLLMPLLAALLASAANKYPFGGRFVLFLLPATIIFLAEGADRLLEVRRLPLLRAAALAAIAAVIGFQAGAAAFHVVAPVRRENIKPVLRHLEQRWRDGDRLYVYHAAQYAFRFYGESGYLDTTRDGRRAPLFAMVPARDDAAGGAAALLSRPPALMIGLFSPSDAGAYLRQLGRLRGSSRVWVLFSNSHTDHPGEEHAFLAYLDSFGRMLDAFREDDAAVYLYDLRAPRDAPMASRTSTS